MFGHERELGEVRVEWLDEKCVSIYQRIYI